MSFWMTRACLMKIRSCKRLFIFLIVCLSRLAILLKNIAKLCYHINELSSEIREFVEGAAVEVAVVAITVVDDSSAPPSLSSTASL